MYKRENFSREIIDLICDDWRDDEQLVIDALVYLYNTTTDDEMIEQIVWKRWKYDNAKSQT